MCLRKLKTRIWLENWKLCKEETNSRTENTITKNKTIEEFNSILDAVEERISDWKIARRKFRPKHEETKGWKIQKRACKRLFAKMIMITPPSSL